MSERVGSDILTTLKLNSELLDQLKIIEIDDFETQSLSMQDQTL